MFKQKIILHSNITSNTLDEIIKIKSVAWPYSYKDQLRWINNNLKNTDLHLLLLKKEQIVAYLNIIPITIIINNNSHNAFGVGNVCSIQKNKGYGKELIKKVNHFLLAENKAGLLFCKHELVRFYKINDWKTIEKSSTKLNFNNNDIETMIYNYNSHIKNIEYSGHSF